jgi:hypothetical protein
MAPTTWVQGHTGSLVSDVGWSVEWRPEFVRLKAERAGITWIHFGVPVTREPRQTPQLEAITLSIRTWGEGRIDEVQLWSGAHHLKTVETTLRAPSGGTRAEKQQRHGGLVQRKVQFGTLKLDSGPLGISIQVTAAGPRDAVAIAAVGAAVT